MAKSDGVVTALRGRGVRQGRPGRRPRRGPGVERLFDLAKKTTNGFEAYARQLATTFRDEPALLEDVLDGLFHIARADGAHPRGRGALPPRRRGDLRLRRGRVPPHRRPARSARRTIPTSSSASTTRPTTPPSKARHRALVAENHPGPRHRPRPARRRRWPSPPGGSPPSTPPTTGSRRSAGCGEASTPDSPLASRVAPSPNHGERRAGPVDMLILHYTGMESAAPPCSASPTRWRRSRPITSCWRMARIVQMVPEGRRAWHAGRAAWNGMSRRELALARDRDRQSAAMPAGCRPIRRRRSRR